MLLLALATFAWGFPQTPVLSPTELNSADNVPQLSTQFSASVILSSVSPFQTRLSVPAPRVTPELDEATSAQIEALAKWALDLSNRARPGYGNVTWSVDASISSSVLAQSFDMQIFDAHCIRNTTTYSYANTAYLINNDACAVLPGSKFGNVWAWVQVSHPAGSAWVDGQECQLWEYSSPDLRFNGTVCVVGDTPIVLVLSTWSAWYPGMEPSPQTSVFNFQTFNPYAPPAEVFQIPTACTSAPTTCEDKGPKVLDLYAAHPHTIYDITGQDVADVLGDVAFTCMDVSSNRTERDGYDVVSHFEIQVSTKWSQYAPCNGHPPVCLGPEEFLVGREQAFGCGGQLAGRCTEDSKVGYWYSLTAGGKCQEGQSVEAGECSWKIIRRVKTVTIDCLFDTQGMFEQCREPSTDAAVSVFQNAFAVDDLTQGGCPDVGPN